jgi:hypothetical protein
MRHNDNIRRLLAVHMRSLNVANLRNQPVKPFRDLLRRSMTPINTQPKPRHK